VIPDRPRVVLLVDDAEDCLSTLDLALQSVPGIVLRWAHSAEDALKLLALDQIAAVVTDLQLPQMTGLELITRMRGERGSEEIPIMVISAAADPAAPQKALESGANAFFSKPFSPAAVRRKLEELMHA
jgi:CheY-like chemotaxis protein